MHGPHHRLMLARTRRRVTVTLAPLALVGLLAAGCSDDAGSQGTAEATTTSTAGKPRPGPSRPAGSAADVSQELTGGAGHAFMGSATGGVPAGVEEHEFLASGTATDYAAEGGMPADGAWTFRAGTTAPYRTRVVVRRPADPDQRSGTVVLEWLNVSGGLDADPDYASLAEEITRRGHTWVGVSAQLIGVEGGPVLVSAPGAEDIVGKGLKALDPARYASLEHPGDGYAFDIFTQVARAARAGGPAFGGTAADVVLAAGESQSAVALTTYYNGVQPITRAFDGFLVHSRAFVPLPLVAPGQYADLAGSMTNPTAVRLRGDLAAPVVELQSEGDVVGVLDSQAVRQPDSDTFRLWEVAGTAHADTHLLGPLAGVLDCGVPINDAPMHVVAKAALRSLDEWVRNGQAPPEAPRIELTSGVPPAVQRDADGIAVGGIRTPPVDVPVDVLTGAPGPSKDLICLLMGSTTPLPAARVAELHPSREAYDRQWAAAADRATKAGFVLADDRAALDAYAEPSRVQ